MQTNISNINNKDFLLHRSTLFLFLDYVFNYRYDVPED